MELLDKLTILADAAKYDAACTSSGLDRAAGPAAWEHPGRRMLPLLLRRRPVHLPAQGAAYQPVRLRLRLLRQLPLQRCARAAFTPRELAELTIGFYRRNYIEGLFLSSAVWAAPTAPPRP